MLKIRLTRVGKKKQPHYRVVVADVEAPRDGRIVERIGHYNPLTEPVSYDIDEGRALHWLSVGAQPTDAVRDLLKKQGTFGRLARLHAGEPLEELVAEFTGEPVAKAGITSTPEAAATEVVEEPETEVGEAYTEVEAEEEETVVDEIVDTVSDTAEDAVDTVSEAVAEIRDVLLDEEEE